MTEKIEMEKVILDCGAGGGRPPLGLFAEWGYRCYGIDISEDAINAAKQFASKYNLEMDMRVGDFRNIPFDDESFSYVYTQNSVGHLSKKDVEIAIREMKRVLRPGGLLFIDFMSVDCSYCNEETMGKLVGDYEFLGIHGEEEALHSFFRNDEADRYFEDMETVRKKKVESINLHKNTTSTDVQLWYYLRKLSK
ncbi:MAG: class I SAM-dependent methyltransferase [Candidatus Thorarchaeota archaeon]